MSPSFTILVHKRVPRLSKSISAPQYFCIAFGCMGGAGWTTGLGELVSQAGLLGAVTALVVAGAAISLVAICYGKIGAVHPNAGGELVYAYDLGGSAAAFATGWILVLLYVASCAFLAVSLGATAEMLFPRLAGPIMYRLLGQDMHLGGISLGLGCALFLWWINRKGARMSARVQGLATYVRVGLTALFLLVALVFAQPTELSAIFNHPPADLKVTGFLSVFATAPFLYSGFSVVAAMAEEADVPVKWVGRAILGSVVAATIFYVVLSICLNMGTPWTSKLVLAVTLLGIFTAWNSFLLAGSRVIFAVARAGFSAPRLEEVLPQQGTPASAIGLVSVASIVTIFLGRGFLLPLANIGSICFGAMYIVTCLALLKQGRSQQTPTLGYVAPGGRFTVPTALLVSVLLTLVALLQPALAGGGRIPAEWMALGYYGVLGVVFWLTTKKFRAALPETARAIRLRGR